MIKSFAHQLPAFISYSHADERLYGYATALKELLDTKLAPLLAERGLRGLDNRQAFIDVGNLPANGSLSEAVKRAIERSFALFIVVGPGYVDSHWCLQELNLFRQKHVGRIETLLDRLFVIILDPVAEKNLLNRWPLELALDSIRQLFHRNGEPIQVRATRVSRDGSVQFDLNPDFDSKLTKVLRGLADRITAAHADNELAAVPPPFSAAIRVQGRSRRVVLGVVPDELDDALRELSQQLVAAGFDVQRLSEKTLLKREMLVSEARDCAAFVQPLARTVAPLLADLTAGGHLSIVRDCLQNFATCVWWEPGDLAPSERAGVDVNTTMHDTFYRTIESLIVRATSDQLVEHLERQIAATRPGQISARVLIESSPEYPRHWRRVEQLLADFWPSDAIAVRPSCAALPFEGSRTLTQKGFSECAGIVLLCEDSNFTGVHDKAVIVDQATFQQPHPPTRFVVRLLTRESDGFDVVWDTVRVMQGGEQFNGVVLDPERFGDLLRQIAARAMQES